VGSLALAAVACWATAAAPACPDDGATTVFRQDKGFAAYRAAGEATYRSFFRGNELEAVDPDAGSGRAEFWLDGLFVQWMRVDDSEFLKSSARTPSDVLEAFYGHESGHLLRVAREQALDVRDLARFEHEEKHDGVARRFLIWTAILGRKGEASRQYWIATRHARGVVLLTMILRSLDDDSRARSVIDSYLANFSAVRGDECAALSAAKRP
jgi:hypothetical protein